MSVDIINVSGYGWTGSSALVDFLQGVENLEHFGTEFRLIKDPGGIIELEDALVNSWTSMKSGVAIRRFLNLAEKLGRSDIPLGPTYGMGYNKYCNGKFYKHTQSYIESIADVEYKGSNIHMDLFTNPWEKYPKWIFHKLLGEDLEYNLYFSSHQTEFLSETQKYIKNIIDSSISNSNTQGVILDQAIPPTQVSRSLSYFKDAKVILVDRDPRDIYIDCLDARSVPTDSIDDFITYYQARRHMSEDLKRNPNVLRIYFEDLVMEFERTKEELLDFLPFGEIGLDMSKSEFHPKDSIQNVGMYKKYNNLESEMELLYDSLKSNCWNWSD